MTKSLRLEMDFFGLELWVCYGHLYFSYGQSDVKKQFIGQDFLQDFFFFPKSAVANSQIDLEAVQSLVKYAVTSKSSIELAIFFYFRGQ